jgi:NhaA family Na+:H+ antiporter
VSSDQNQRPLHDHGHPPEAWPAARTAARLLLAPVERFLAIEASSGILLLIAAAVALTWANSPLRDSYQALWHTPLGLRVGGFAFERDLHFFINDGLMVVFFFVVGLEIRREIHGGELSELRRAALPLFAALGGMLVPALIYLGANAGTPAAAGWGVPMATDIAFAVGVLALLGKRVPPALRILLLALAVIDDLGAIVVIALFYSSGVQVVGLLVAAAGIAVLLLAQKLGVRRSLFYVGPGLVIWAGAYLAGVHPTLAGVVVGLLTPVRAWLSPEDFAGHAAAAAAAAGQPGARSVASALAGLDEIRRETIAPVERLQHALHPWVAYVIMPLFALANAGVPLGQAQPSGAGRMIFLGAAVGLVLGKPIGVVALSFLAVRLRLAALPAGVGWRGVLVVGIVAGIGFTMAIFIAGLAFPPGPALETAKLGVLSASLVAGVLGLLGGRVLLPAAPAPEGAATAAEAEASTSV